MAGAANSLGLILAGRLIQGIGGGGYSVNGRAHHQRPVATATVTAGAGYCDGHVLSRVGIRAHPRRSDR
jgi:hypothetical protein